MPDIKPTLIARFKQRGFSFKTIQIHHNSSPTIIISPNRTDRATLITELAAQWLKSGFEIISIGSNSSHHQNADPNSSRFNTLCELYPNHFKKYTTQCDIQLINTKGKLLFIDDIQQLSQSNPWHQIQKIIDESSNAFITFRDSHALTYTPLNVINADCEYQTAIILQATNDELKNIANLHPNFRELNNITKNNNLSSVNVSEITICNHEKTYHVRFLLNLHTARRPSSNSTKLIKFQA